MGTKYAASVAAALLGLGGAATSASANIVKATGGPGFSGLSAAGTGHVFTATGGSGTVVVTCSTAAFANISGTGNSNATFNSAYVGCSADISGVPCAAFVTTPGIWTLTQGGTKTGGWSFSVSLGSAAQIEVNDAGCGLKPSDCTINVPAQSGLTGVSALASNMTTSSVKLSGTIGGISWNSSTANCGIGSGNSTATYSINGATGITVYGIRFT